MTMPTAIRQPAHRVSERAVAYWRLTALAGSVVLWVLLGVGYVAARRPGLVGDGADRGHRGGRRRYLVAMPRVRFRVHRWEVTPTAVHTRSGWLTTEERIAPLSRVQTVDSAQGPLMRPFGLMSITVTTASAAGPITIDCLDVATARAVVAELTEITGRSAGDAT